MAEPLLHAVELGGTKCFALLARGDRIVERVRVATTAPAATLRALADACARWPVPDAIGVATFGPVMLDRADPRFGQVLTTPKTEWIGHDVLGPFRRAGIPIAIETDVAAAALAEGRWGGSRGCATHAYCTIGTGIGLGLVANGGPVHGLLHPEAGHIRFRRAPGDDFPGICPFHGDCLEGLASGPAIVARARTTADHIAPDAALWGFIAADLAELMTQLILTVAPERIAIGGGVGWGQRDHLLPRIIDATRARLAGYLPPHVDPARIIVAAGLGEEAGPLGAVAVALGALGR